METYGTDTSAQRVRREDRKNDAEKDKGRRKEGNERKDKRRNERQHVGDLTLLITERVRLVRRREAGVRPC
jgi:hypothetical protein